MFINNKIEIMNPYATSHQVIDCNASTNKKNEGIAILIANNKKGN